MRAELLLVVTSVYSLTSECAFWTIYIIQCFYMWGLQHVICLLPGFLLYPARQVPK